MQRLRCAAAFFLLMNCRFAPSCRPAEITHVFLALHDGLKDKSVSAQVQEDHFGGIFWPSDNNILCCIKLTLCHIRYWCHGTACVLFCCCCVSFTFDWLTSAWKPKHKTEGIIHIDLIENTLRYISDHSGSSDLYLSWCSTCSQYSVNLQWHRHTECDRVFSCRTTTAAPSLFLSDRCDSTEALIDGGWRTIFWKFL